MQFILDYSNNETSIAQPFSHHHASIQLYFCFNALVNCINSIIRKENICINSLEYVVPKISRFRYDSQMSTQIDYHFQAGYTVVIFLVLLCNLHSCRSHYSRLIPFTFLFGIIKHSRFLQGMELALLFLECQMCSERCTSIEGKKFNGRR